MAVWQPDNLSSFLVFFMPGFISLKIFDSIVPNERRDFSKSVFDAVAYSSINFAVFYPLFTFIFPSDFYKTNPYLYYLLFVVAFLGMPILWPFIYKRVISLEIVSSHIINPFLKPWDFLFNKKEPAWIIVHLKDGRLVGGIYGEDSFASSYPAEEQIYLEQIWKLDEKGKFIEAIERSKGMIISKSEIVTIEFFKV